jgi:hypothetical protein
VQAPAVQTQDPKSKPDCYGVFCLTYDLKAVSIPCYSTVFILCMYICCLSLLCIQLMALVHDFVVNMFFNWIFGSRILLRRIGGV